MKILVRPLLLKAPVFILLTVLGIVISVRELQFAKVRSSILLNEEFVGNVTLDNEVQLLKASSSIISTEGKEISVKAEQPAKAFS